MNRRGQPEKIDSIVESFLSNRGYLTACNEQEITRQWPKIVGEKIAQISVCTRVEDGIAYVRVPESPWRQELSFLKYEIIGKIRSRKKWDSIKDIVFY